MKIISSYIEYSRYRPPKKDQISINYSLTDEFMQGLVYPDSTGCRLQCRAWRKKTSRRRRLDRLFILFIDSPDSRLVRARDETSVSIDRSLKWSWGSALDIIINYY